MYVDVCGCIYVCSIFNIFYDHTLSYAFVLYLSVKAIRRPPRGQQRHTIFFHTTSLNFMINKLLKIRYDPGNSFNWSKSKTSDQYRIIPPTSVPSVFLNNISTGRDEFISRNLLGSSYLVWFQVPAFPSDVPLITQRRITYSLVHSDFSQRDPLVRPGFYGHPSFWLGK